jgi:hypothetical protein
VNLLPRKGTDDERHEPGFVLSGAAGVGTIEPTIVRCRRKEDRMTLWIVVQGNFAKEATKFAVYQNPNLKLLQVERSPPLPFLWLTR